MPTRSSPFSKHVSAAAISNSCDSTGVYSDIEHLFSFTGESQRNFRRRWRPVHIRLNLSSGTSADINAASAFTAKYVTDTFMWRCEFTYIWPSGGRYISAEVTCGAISFVKCITGNSFQQY